MRFIEVVLDSSFFLGKFCVVLFLFVPLQHDEERRFKNSVYGYAGVCRGDAAGTGGEWI